jgi:hypothetical protein
MLLAPHKTGTRPRRDLHPARVAIFLALLGAHGLAVLYFASLRGPVPDSADDGFATTVFFLEDKPKRHAPQVTILPARSAFAPNPADRMPQRPLPPETPVQSEQETTAPTTIDWAKEAERVAAERIEADEALRRKASRLSAGEGTSVGAGPALPAHRQFGWDYARTHRVESLPEGGLIVNLNDRCSLVFRFPMLLGSCKIGKIESRADLFAHMRE